MAIYCSHRRFKAPARPSVKSFIPPPSLIKTLPTHKCFVRPSIDSRIAVMCFSAAYPETRSRLLRNTSLFCVICCTISSDIESTCERSIGSGECISSSRLRMQSDMSADLMLHVNVSEIGGGEVSRFRFYKGAYELTLGLRVPRRSSRQYHQILLFQPYHRL